MVFIFPQWQIQNTIADKGCWLHRDKERKLHVGTDNSTEPTQLSFGYYTFKDLLVFPVLFKLSLMVLMSVISRIDVVHNQFSDFFLFIYFS